MTVWADCPTLRLARPSRLRAQDLDAKRVSRSLLEPRADHRGAPALEERDTGALIRGATPVKAPTDPPPAALPPDPE
jgi:hypothetical protein